MPQKVSNWICIPATKALVDTQYIFVMGWIGINGLVMLIIYWIVVDCVAYMSCVP